MQKLDKHTPCKWIYGDTIVCYFTITSSGNVLLIAMVYLKKFINFLFEFYLADNINMEKIKILLSFFCIFFLSVNGEILELETLDDLKNIILDNEAVSIFFYSHLLPATAPIKSKYYSLNKFLFVTFRMISAASVEKTYAM